jgi:hypothetical protein
VIALNGCARATDARRLQLRSPWGGGTIGGALAGRMIGGGVGGGIVATSGETERQAEDYATAIGIGVIAGSLIGASSATAPSTARTRRNRLRRSPHHPGTDRKEEDRLRWRQLRLRQVDDPSRRRRDPGRSGAHPARRPRGHVSVDGHTDARGTDRIQSTLVGASWPSRSSSV